MGVIIEEVIAETTEAPGPRRHVAEAAQAQTPARQSAWIERRDLARCMEQIARRRDRLDAE
jgi:hypothetical protein